MPSIKTTVHKARKNYNTAAKARTKISITYSHTPNMLLSDIRLPVEFGGTLGHLLLILRHPSMSAWSNVQISSPDDAELNSTLSNTVLPFCPRALQQTYVCFPGERLADCNVSDI